MSDSLTALEARRRDLVAEFEALGDLRRGSITGTGGRCGSPSCHCHGPGDPAMTLILGSPTKWKARP